MDFFCEIDHFGCIQHRSVHLTGSKKSFLEDEVSSVMTLNKLGLFRSLTCARSLSFLSLSLSLSLTHTLSLSLLLSLSYSRHSTFLFSRMISHTLVQVLSHIKSLLFILYDSLLSLSLSLSQTNLVSVTSSSLSQIFSLGRTNTFSDPLSQSLIQNSGTLSLSVLARSLSLLSHFHFVLSRVYARFPGLSAFLRKIQLFSWSYFNENCCGGFKWTKILSNEILPLEKWDWIWNTDKKNKMDLS